LGEQSLKNSKEKNEKFCSYVFFFVSLHDFVDFGLEGAKIHLTKG
jgi:hypothetical protein